MCSSLFGGDAAGGDDASFSVTRVRTSMHTVFVPRKASFVFRGPPHASFVSARAIGLPLIAAVSHDTGEAR